MQRFITVAIAAATVFAQTPAEVKDRPLHPDSRLVLGDGTVRDRSALDLLTRAQAEVERLRGLVTAGVLPRAALDKAERDLTDAQDEAILKQTLYGEIGVEELSPEQSLAMTAAAERQLERQKERLEAAKKLVAEGVAARTTLTPFLEELDARRRTVDLAASRARVMAELAELARAEEQLELDIPESTATGPVRLAERFDGDGVFTDFDFRRVANAFERKFSRPLPVSARGSTALHRSMGFDHRGRVDVAVSPGDPEGAWLVSFLRNERLPYFAFRGAIRGKATGPHVHIGPPSTRYRAAD